MKKIITLSLLFISLLCFAQVPQGISYQAIALNTSGNTVVSSNVRLRLSVLDASSSGSVLYSETHLKTTNAQGLFNLVIGQGTVVSGVFNTINWALNTKFLKVEMDATGGTTYVLVGTTQLLSVPYALAAGSLVKNNTNFSNRDISGNGYNIVYTNLEAKGFNGTSWYTTTLTGEVLGSITSNIATAIFTTLNAKAFNGTSWYTTTLNGVFKGAASSNDTVVVFTDTEAKGFGSTSWYTTTLNGNVIGTIASNTNIVVYTDTQAKGFNGTSWYTTTLNGNVLGSISNGNNIVIYTNLEAKGFNGTSWYTTTLNGTVIGSNN